MTVAEDGNWKQLEIMLINAIFDVNVDILSDTDPSLNTNSNSIGNFFL